MADINEEVEVTAVEEENQDCGIHSVAAKNGNVARTMEDDEIKDHQHIAVRGDIIGDNLLAKVKSESNRDNLDENSHYLKQQLIALQRELDDQKIENDVLKREHEKLTEQLTEGQESTSKSGWSEWETLQGEHVKQLEQLEAKVKSLQQTLDELEKEKKILVGEKVQLLEQLEAKKQEHEDSRNELANVSARLKEQLAQEKSLSGDHGQMVERQLKQLQSQVTSLQSEKNHVLGQRDELQSILEDLRLRYAVATEELSQSNEATHVATDAFNKMKAQLEHVNRIVEIQSAESLELTRQLELKSDAVRKLEAANSEHGRNLENIKSGNIAEHRSVNGSSDALDRYSVQVMEHLRQNAPLIERLQIELDSAQNAINALTNQNTELKSQLKSRDSQSAIGQSVCEFDGEKRTLEAKVDELFRENQLLQKRLEFVEEDLARQVPATINGDIVTKPHFEALQGVMKRIEVKYTQVMRDKAELLDTVERLEHIIMQLQDESNTIGEYVSLYHHQRFLLREKTAQKDGYIYRLAHERTALHNQLAQLQMLIVKLLNERTRTHSPSNVDDSITAAHSSVVEPVNDISDQRETGLPISQSDSLPDSNNIHEPGFNGHSLSTLPDDIPSGRDTAQEIMYLLNEIGTSKLLNNQSYNERNYIHCGHCSGQILVA